MTIIQNIKEYLNDKKLKMIYDKLLLKDIKRNLERNDIQGNYLKYY